MELLNKLPILKVFTYCTAGFVVLVLYVRLVESTTVFLPSKGIARTPQEIGLPYEEVFFTTEDKVRLNGWFLSAGAKAEDKATVLFFHGNAGNIGDRLDKLALFSGLGVNVFIIDYRGYGKSEGRPTEQGMYKDARAAYDYLMERKEVDPKKIVLYGASLGGVAAIDLMLQRDIACLIIDSGFTSAADMGRVILPFVPSFILSVKLDNLSKIKDVAIPKLFIHSPEDEVVPYALGRKLYREASPPKGFLKIGGDHNAGFLFHQKVYTDGIREFLRTNDLL